MWSSLGGSTEATTEQEPEKFMCRSDRKMKSFQEQSPLEWKRKQKRPVYLPCTVFTLEKQPCGEPMEFDLYEESDLPFLDPSTEIGREVSKKIV